MITVPDFRTMLNQVTPHISTDDTLPLLCGVRIEACRDGVFLIATDRFSLAVARHPEPPVDLWTAFMTTADIKAYRALAAAAGTRAASLELDCGDVRITVGGYTLPLPDRTGLGAFPDWRKRLRDAVASAPHLTDPVSLAPHLLVRWNTPVPGHQPRRTRTANTGAGVDRGGALTVWSGGPHEPVVFARGDHFLGAQMPIRFKDDTTDRAAAVRDAWSGALAERTWFNVDALTV